MRNDALFSTDDAHGELNPKAFSVRYLRRCFERFRNAEVGSSNLLPSTTSFRHD
jgi:hypothetical protein